MSGGDVNAGMSPIDAAVVRERVPAPRPVTLEEVGVRFGVSRQRFAQREERCSPARTAREGHHEGDVIEVRVSAYGSFLCTCLVTFEDGEQVSLYRYIDFEMGKVIAGLRGK